MDVRHAPTTIGDQRGNEREDHSLVHLYKQRLRIASEEVLSPTWPTLQRLVERHLEYIPFENLSLHMVEDEEDGPKSRVTTDTEESMPPIVLEKALLVDKLLRHHRGGCCLELNGLFSFLLQDLGYSPVLLVPCWVYAGRERGHGSKRAKFRTRPSHFVVMVGLSSCSPNDDSTALVDVGLGEPPLGPLCYSSHYIGQPQVTAEGMTSRIVWDPQGAWKDGSTGKLRRCLLLEWWREASKSHDKGIDGADGNEGHQDPTGDSGYWEPRLQWDLSDAPLEQAPSSLHQLANRHTLESFRPVIDILLHPKSSFSRKMIVCKLTPSYKLSLSGGRRLKRTAPRYPIGHVAETRLLESEEEIVKVLWVDFHVRVPPGFRLQLPSLAVEEDATRWLWDHL